MIAGQGNQGPAQIVRLGHRGTPSIDVSDEIAILAARPIASLRWREMDSNYQYAGTVNVDDDGFARDILRMAAAMAASARHDSPLDRAAVSTTVSSTGCTSEVERLRVLFETVRT